MDVDDDDAFLYGDESPPKTEVALPPSAEQAPESFNTPTASTSANGLSSSMAASLAAYGIEPSSAVVDNPEDGGVEEEDEEDEDEEDSDESEDDVKVVFTGQNPRTLDLRKPQTAPSNVIGIGKWAQSSTGAAAPAVAPSTPQQVSTPSKPVQMTANQTTEYTPTSRPGVSQPSTSSAPTLNAPLTNPPISSAPNEVQPTLQSQSQPQSQAQQLNPNVNLPPSSLPPVTAASTHPKIDPTNPSGIIPSTGQSVYEIDMTQFEGSGQPWRKPGSSISDWFNFGFDEISYPRYLRYRTEMEQGRAAMMNVPPMAPIPQDIANMLHMPFNPMLQQQQQQQAQQQQQQQQQQQMQIMANQIQQQMGMMNPQMQAQMQQMMAMQGLDMSMMGNNQPGFGIPNQMMQNQPQGGMPQQNMMRQGNTRPSMTPTPQPAASGTPEAGEEVVKQEEGVETGGEISEPQTQTINPAIRGRVPVRGVPVRGVPLRGRGVAVPLGPRAGFVAPTGPKAGRFRDKDKVDTSGAGSLDYGASEGGNDSDVPSKSEKSISAKKEPEDLESKSRSRTRSRSASPLPRKSSSRKSSRRDHDSYSSNESDHEREKRKTSKKTRDREKEKDKRKREEGGGSATLGPGGWESEGEEEERRSSRRKRSPSEESDKRTRRSKRR
ncbi:uncharacterized protein IL334_006364 [Kwoniella shivajii]|uniref:Pre-mRNA polyadenylation factor Fip1 domain-containing protein n=1 Tax=Kwoniella shivajii TaxID=564305 RepID=A0ABZ1D7M5_9TREE|nr:hypothetical protein IL334_006364 [Kwoniella shivajii]